MSGEAQSPVPEGFSLHTRSSPVTDAWAPIYASITPAAFILGLRIAAAHCNSRGLLHGGVIAALADNAMGLSLATRCDPPASPVTTSLSVDYFGKAAIGAWLTFETDHVSQQGQNGFTHALVKADGVAVARASAVFRLLR
ncbi:MAG: PaaI family thioesterase [Sphingomonadales bacterium]|jgi:acyl-coenzyme A thioesterase PaaI-like protein